MHIWYSKGDFTMFGNTNIYRNNNGQELIGTAAMVYYDPSAYSWNDKEYLGEGEYVRQGNIGTITDYIRKAQKKY